MKKAAVCLPHIKIRQLSTMPGAVKNIPITRTMPNNAQKQSWRRFFTRCLLFIHKIVRINNIAIINIGIKDIKKLIPVSPVLLYSNDTPPKPSQPCHRISIKIPISKKVIKIKAKTVTKQCFFSIVKSSTPTINRI